MGEGNSVDIPAQAESLGDAEWPCSDYMARQMGRWSGNSWGLTMVYPQKSRDFTGFHGISMGFQWDNMGHMMVYPPVKEHDHEETCSEN